MIKKVNSRNISVSQKMESKNVKTKVLAAAICVVFFVATSGTGAASYPEVLVGKELPHTPVATEYAPGEILVKFKPYVNVVAGSMTNYRQGTFVVSTLPSGTQKLKIPPGETVEDMVNTYNELPNVEYAEPNYVVHAHMVPNDPGYQYQWHFDNDEYGGINMECAWNMSTGTDVVVAVLDTGVAYENYNEYCEAPDLKGTTFVQGYDFINMDAHPNDDHYHGTHVTGTVAQTTNNGTCVAGVAFGCKIMPVKVLDETGSGTHFNVSKGIYYATDNDTDVISMSLAGPDTSATLEDAVAYAYNNNVTVIACAGNNYEEGNLPQYPAAYDDYVIAVGATIYNETRADYSNTGAYLDLVAPGGDLSLDQNNDGQPDGVLQQTFVRGYPCNFSYFWAPGTSMATPHVSGVAALLIANGVTGPDNVREILESTAEDKGTPGWDEEYGWGILDACAALQSLMCHGTCYNYSDCSDTYAQNVTCKECVDAGKYWKPNEDAICFGTETPRELCLNYCPDCCNGTDDNGDGKVDYPSEDSCTCGLDPSEDYPMQPIPELPAIVLLSIGLLALVGYTLRKRTERQ